MPKSQYAFLYRLLAAVAGVAISIGMPGLVPMAAAQSQGAIIGVVTDTSGAVLPGVTVVATGPALQVPQIEAVTNERGEYRLSPLPPGVFTVTFELARFPDSQTRQSPAGSGFHCNGGPGVGTRDRRGDGHRVRAISSCRRHESCDIR